MNIKEMPFLRDEGRIRTELKKKVDECEEERR
jgi:hypothetical protein